jgi:hypothetical protein
MRDVSRQIVVSDFLKSSSEIRASPPVGLDMGDDDTDYRPTV